MNKIFLFVSILLVISSCSNEFELHEKWKDIPVTYGILNPKDTAQYIRVERVFNDPNTAAPNVAQIPDSLYYENITVRLSEVGSPGKSFDLVKVDGNKEGYVRNTGVFANSPNYLYKLKQENNNLNPGAKYSLLVLNRNDDTLTHAFTKTVTDINIYRPNTNTKPIKLNYIYRFTIGWDGGYNAGNFDVLVYINIKERDISAENEWIDKTLVWKAAKEITEHKYSIIGKDLYIFLQNNLYKDDNIKRKFVSFSIKVRGMGIELKEYSDILHANLGITSSQQIPTYTNLSNGYGVFSSINFDETLNFHLAKEARDSIKYGIYTKFLNFE